MDMIHEYIRERVAGKGKQKVGIMVGLVHNGVICTGFSKTNLKAGDTFDKDEGFRIAKNRALGEMESPELPPQLVRPMRELQMRCVKYFQQADLLSTKGCYNEMFKRSVNRSLSQTKSCNCKCNKQNTYLINDIIKMESDFFAGRSDKTLTELLDIEKNFIMEGGLSTPNAKAMINSWREFLEQV